MAAVAILAAAPSAAAHPYLVRAEPAPGATLTAAPKELRLLFTERLDGPSCRVTLVGPRGERHPTAVQVTGTSLVAAVGGGDLGRGAYRLEWSVIGEDGHRVDGDYGLGIGQRSSAAASAVAGRAAAPGGAALRAALVAVDMALAALVLSLAFRSVDGKRRSPSVFIVRTVWGVACVLACVAVALAWAAGSLDSSVTGRLALQRLFATVALFPIVFGLLRRPLPRRVYGASAVVVLLVGVALGSHALGASTGRAAQVVVLSVHLLAASVWLAAIVALLAGTPARRLAVPVGASIVVVVASGVFNAHVQLGGARELVTSVYGRVLDAKVALVVVMIVLGLAAAVWRRWEAAVGAGVLVLAGILGQLPNPVSVPAFSQRHPLPAGSTVATTSTGSALLAVALSPGRPGLNRLVVSVQHPDANDVPIPASGVTSIDVSASCACGAPQVSARLDPVDGGPALAGSVLLPRAGRWSVRLTPPDNSEPGVVDIDVSLPPTADDVVVGVPADLSGADANACQDELLGVQVAAAEVNERGVAGGRAMRVVAVDSHGPDPAASVGALRSLGARLLALPCGPPDAVDAVQRAASAAGVPVVGGGGAQTPWTWPTQFPPAVEGRALARQLENQGGRRPLLVVGAGPREQAVARAIVGAPSIPLGEPGATAARIRAADPDVVLFDLSADDTPALLQALATVDPGWGPARGALGTSSMMSATVASTGGEWFKQGRVSLASDVSPADGSSLQYATRLQQQIPGRHPSVDGVRGYVTGWLIANVLHRAADASPSAVRRVLNRDLRSFVFGPTRVRLDGSGTERGADTVAFFKTVFTNPLALAGLPGQVGHAGVFLGQGSFVQVTPWRRR